MISHKLTIAGRTYNVEIEDLDAVPIVVNVDGERFEVARDSGGPAGTPESQVSAGGAADMALWTAPAVAPRPTAAIGAKVMVAPMPGAVLAVKVQPGDTVAYGDEILVLEAMKMKSSLRTEQAGTIAKVLVTAGQSVAAGDALVTFE